MPVLRLASATVSLLLAAGLLSRAVPRPAGRSRARRGRDKPVRHRGTVPASVAAHLRGTNLPTPLRRRHLHRLDRGRQLPGQPAASTDRVRPTGAARAIRRYPDPVSPCRCPMSTAPGSDRREQPWMSPAAQRRSAPGPSRDCSRASRPYASSYHPLWTVRQSNPASGPSPAATSSTTRATRTGARCSTWPGTSSPSPQVKRYIDQIAQYKINYLHLHLSDDQGWRIADRRLAAAGHLRRQHPGGRRRRAASTPRRSTTRSSPTPRPATSPIVPEIDMPGHTNAALASYAELNCDGVAPPLYTGTESASAPCACSKEMTYTFVERRVHASSPPSPPARTCTSAATRRSSHQPADYAHVHEPGAADRRQARQDGHRLARRSARRDRRAVDGRPVLGHDHSGRGRWPRRPRTATKIMLSPANRPTST